MYSSFETSTGSNIAKWKSSGVYDKDNGTLEAVNTLKGAVPRLTIASQNGKLNVGFSLNMLKQSKIVYDHGSAINVYITFRLKKRTIYNTKFSIGNSLFGAVSIQKDATDVEKYKYSGYRVYYDFNSSFTHGSNQNPKNLIMFGVSSSTRSTNRLNNIYMLGKDFDQGLDATTICADKMFKIDPSVFEKMYVMSIHYNGTESYLFINGTQELKFTAASNLGKNKFCVGNISDELSVQNMQETGLYGNVYDVPVDYWPHSISKIYDTHRYLMKKIESYGAWYYKMFGLIKKVAILVLITIAQAKDCFMLKDQKCGAKKVIIDNDYVTYPYKINVNRFIGSCNDVDNPYFKVCLPDVVKNISLKVFDMMSQRNELKNMSFHESCKCDCLLYKKFVIINKSGIKINADANV